MSLLLADWQALWCFWIIEGNLGHDSPSHGVTSTLGSEWSSNFESPSMCRDSISQFNQVHLESVLIQRIIQHLIDLSWRKPQKSDHILLCGIYKAFQVWREKGSSARFGILYPCSLLISASSQCAFVSHDADAHPSKTLVSFISQGRDALNLFSLAFFSTWSLSVDLLSSSFSTHIKLFPSYAMDLHLEVEYE